MQVLRTVRCIPAIAHVGCFLFRSCATPLARHSRRETLYYVLLLIRTLLHTVFDSIGFGCGMFWSVPYGRSAYDVL